MTASLIVALAWCSLALIVTLSVLLLLVFWQSWRTDTGRSLLPFVGSLAALQSTALLTRLGAALDLADYLLKGLANLTLMAFWLVTLAALAVLLQAAGRYKDAWFVVHRAGIVGLVAIQPALWAHNLVQRSGDLDEHLLHGPFTDLGMVLLSICAVFLALVLAAGWRYWRRIDAPLLAGSILGIVTIQAVSLTTGLYSSLMLTSATGAVASVFIGYYLVTQPTLVPRQFAGPNILPIVSGSLTGKRLLGTALADIAADARRMIRTDSVSVLLAVEADRLEITATDGALPALVGRQIHIGEGLAGRVMQTLHAMRIDNYRSWNGRSAGFEDLPLYASISIPLIYHGALVGVINAHETTPGRVFTERDQTLLEMLAPQAAILIGISRLEREQRATHAILEALLSGIPAAIMVFDAAGTLRMMNETARHYLQTAFGDDPASPSLNELVARAQDTRFAEALVQSTAHPNRAFTDETVYPHLGSLAIRIQHIASDQHDLLVILQQTGE